MRIVPKALTVEETREFKKLWNDHYRGLADAEHVITLRTATGREYWRNARTLFMVYYTIWRKYGGVLRSTAFALTQIVNGSRARRHTVLMSRSHTI